ncbi:hypothetical protein Tco_1448631 [Tanacetum coccineum]
MDGKTENALWEFWIKGGDDGVLMDDIVSSNDKREESDNTDHQNDSSDHELNDISVNNDEEKELLNEGVCKSKKFEVIRCSLGTNEEYIAINICKYKRTDGIV